MDESKKLANFLSELNYNDIVSEVVERSKDLVLDQLAGQLAASTKPWSLAVYKYVKGLGGPEESTIVGYGDSCSLCPC